MKRAKMFPRLMRRRDKLKRKLFEDAMGICMECFEVTQVLNPCCESDVEFDGKIFGRDDFEERSKAS